ncbi:FmdB family zinc ribbon protein [Thermopirellula anaerolimosa]
MPTYEYVCDACEHQFETFQSITAAPLVKCPECGKKKLRRLIGTGAAIIFKGSGFYCTDYRSDSYRQAASKDNGKSSSNNGSGNGSSNGSGKGKTSAKKTSSEAKT